MMLQNVSLKSVSPGVLRRNGAVFGKAMPYGDWVKAGKELCAASDASWWWIGDWVNAGERLYGDKYKAALKLRELDEGTLRNVASVSGRIEMSRRRDNLSFWMHAEVAALDPREQDKFLRLAEEQDWTRSELRQAIRKEKATEHDEESGGAVGFVLSKAVGDITRWFRVQLQQTPIEDMPKARREALLRELRPIVEMCDALRR